MACSEEETILLIDNYKNKTFLRDPNIILKNI